MKFSIIIPVYNVAPYLRECLDSVLAQTCNDWECVCVDDGSTDGCAAILDEYGAKDSRFRIIHKSNGGVASARNMALDIIRGEWFLFLDSDDVWAPNLLTVCLAGMTLDAMADIVQFQDRHFHQDAQCTWDGCYDSPAFSVMEFSGPFDRKWMGFVAPKKAFRRECFSDLCEKEYVVGEDLLYLSQCVLRTRKQVCTSLKLYGYRDRISSITRIGVSERKALDTVRYLRDIALEVAKSGRGMTKGTAKWLANTITELFYYEQLSRLAGTHKVVNEWRSALGSVADTKLFGVFQTCRMRLLNQHRIGALAYVLCYLPCWLKRHGIHG